jgi:hypothetical protein
MPKIVKTEMTLPIGGYQGSFSGKNSAKMTLTIEVARSYSTPACTRRNSTRMNHAGRP